MYKKINSKSAKLLTIPLLMITFYKPLFSQIEESIKIIDLLQQLSIAHISAKIQEVPGSINSVAITAISRGDTARFNYLRKEILKHAANIFEDNKKIFREKLALPNRRGLRLLTRKIGEYPNKEIESLIHYMAERTYPEICLLRECDCIKRFNDFDEHTFIENDRGNFERMLACKYLQDQNSSPNIVYTGFATGGLFTELRILTLLLAFKEELENHILFTQDIFEIKKALEMGINREILLCKKWKKHEKTKSQYDIIQDVTINCIHIIDPDYEQTIKTLQEYIDQDIKQIILSKEKTLGDLLRIVQIIQLVNFISAISGKPITICLHNYAKAYVETCNYNPNIKPTIITSADHKVDNLLRFSGNVISFTYIEFMLMLRKIITENTWLGDLNWKIPEKINPLSNVEISIKNPEETRQYLENKRGLINLQEAFIKAYEATHNITYLSL